MWPFRKSKSREEEKGKDLSEEERRKLGAIGAVLYGRECTKCGAVIVDTTLSLTECPKCRGPLKRWSPQV